MGEIVNLRRARKAVARSKAETEAAQNRAKFGRPKKEREAEAAERRLQDRKLDGHALAKREKT